MSQSIRDLKFAYLPLLMKSVPRHATPSLAKEDSRVHYEGVAAPQCQDMTCKKNN